MFYNLITKDWFKYYRYYDARGKCVSYMLILFGLRLYRGDVIGTRSTHRFISLYKYTRLEQKANGDSVFKHIPLLETLLGTVLEHDSIKPIYSGVHTVGNIHYILYIFERYSYFSNVGKMITFNKKEVYQVISPIGDCLGDTFAPPLWTKRPHPNVIINQAKTLKGLIDNFTIKQKDTLQ